MHHPLLYGAKYLITFIIDYNRRVWVYFIERKSEASNVFQRFKIVVENRSGNRNGAFRINKGG